MERNVQISPRLIEELNQWFRDQPPAEIRTNLRKMLFDYLRTEVSTGIPDYYENLLLQLNGLFDLLDQAEKEEAPFYSRYRDRESRMSNLSLGHLMNYLADFVQPAFVFVRSMDGPRKEDPGLYFLTVILDDQQGESGSPWETLFSKATTASSWFSVQTWTFREMRSKLEKGDPWLSLACQKDALLYNPQGREIPEFKTTLWAERRSKGERQFTCHSQKAMHSIQRGEECMSQNDEDAASVFLYGALKHIFSGLLLGFDMDFSKDEDLHQLRQLCRPLGPTVYALQPTSPFAPDDWVELFDQISLGSLGNLCLESPLPSPWTISQLLEWARNLHKETHRVMDALSKPPTEDFYRVDPVLA